MSANYPVIDKRIPRLLFLYVIRLGEFYKIGVSLNPRERVRSMMLHQEPTPVRIYETPDAYALEKALHKRFANKRGYGEWFELLQDDLLEIDQMAKVYPIRGKR